MNWLIETLQWWANFADISSEGKEQHLKMIQEVVKQQAQLASARAIMQRFVDKVDSGLARSTETYGEMKQWMEDER